jgi:hypothetical protein
MARQIEEIKGLEKRALRWGRVGDRARMGQQFGAMLGIDLSRKELRALRGRGKDTEDVAEALAERAGLGEDATADLKKAIKDASEGQKGSGVALAKLRGTVAEAQREQRYKTAEREDPAVRKMDEVKSAIEALGKGTMKTRVMNPDDFPGGEVDPEKLVNTDRPSRSDRRLKKNIEPIEDALDKVSQISGNEFDWRDSGEHDVGVIAQEVQEVVPEAVQDRGDSILVVQYHKLLPLLIEAVKELQADNFELRARMEAMEGMVVP